jgi:protein SCO1/2
VSTAPAPAKKNGTWIALILLAFAGSIVLLKYSLDRYEEAHVHAAQESLPKLSSLPEFKLVTQDGTPVTRDALAGRVWIADVIFTRCEGICPLLTQQMQAVERELPAETGVRFLSVSSDPTYDTPQRLGEYARARGIDTDRWAFATGELEAVKTLVRDGFKLAIGDEPDMHAGRFVLIDQRGAVRGWYDPSDAAQRTRLQNDARLLAAAVPRAE